MYAGARRRCGTGWTRAIHSGRAAACLRRGEIDLKRGVDPTRWFEGAIADCTEALRLTPGRASFYNNRGTAWNFVGLWEQRQGRDHRPPYEKAVADFDRALECNPNDWRAHANRAAALEELGEFARAMAGYEAALRLAPGRPDLAEKVEKCRRRLGQ